MRVNNHIFILLISALLMDSCSCSKSGSFWEWGDDKGSDLSLDFKWDKLKEGESIPGGLKLVLYSDAKKTVLIKDILPEEFTIRVPRGEYKLLVFNNDVQNIAFDRLYDFSNASAYLKSIAETKVQSPDEVMEAQSFYAGNMPGFGTGDNNRTLITVNMSSMTKSIEITINSQFISEITSCSATLTNVASRINLSTGLYEQSSLAYYRFDISGNNGFNSNKQVFAIINPSTCILKLDYTTKEGVSGTFIVPVGEALQNINRGTVSSVALNLEFVKIDMGVIIATLKNWTENITRNTEVI